MKTKLFTIAICCSLQLFAGGDNLPFFGFRPVEPANATNGSKQDLLNYIDGVLELDSTTLYTSKKTGKVLPYEVYEKNRKSGADALVRQQHALLVNRNLNPKTKGQVAQFLGLSLTDYSMDAQRIAVKKAIQSDLLYLAIIPTGLKIYTTGQLIDPNNDFLYVRDSAHYRFGYKLKDGTFEAGLFFNWAKLGIKTIGMDLYSSMLCFNTNAGAMPELDVVKSPSLFNEYGETSNDASTTTPPTTPSTITGSPSFPGAPIAGTTPATTPAKNQNGFACWDLNQNGSAEVSEDQNGDGSINELDCKGSGITLREYNLATENAYLKGKLEGIESCPCPNQQGVPLQQMNPQQVYCQQGGQYVPYQQGQMINAGQEVFYNQGGNWQRKVAIANTVFNGIGTIVGLGLQAWQIWGGSQGWYSPQQTVNVFNTNTLTTTTTSPGTTIAGRGFDWSGVGMNTNFNSGNGTDFGGIR